MARIMLRSTEQAEPTRFPEMPGLSTYGAIEARPLIQGGGLSLFLWHYELEPGAEIRFDKPDHSHLLYVWRGAIDAGGEPAGFDDIVIIERRGEVVIRATGGPAKLLHFYSPVPSAKDAYARGQVIVRRKKELDRHVYPQSKLTLYADSSSDSCDIWFHSGETPDGMLDFVDQLHSHSQDEIIFVVSGSMLVGQRRVGTGTALAVAADTVYSFMVREEGLHFINFRASESFISLVHDGKRDEAQHSERTFITSLPVEA
jgi:quercetin dioxygenase-like cupin family protein